MDLKSLYCYVCHNELVFIASYHVIVLKPRSPLYLFPQRSLALLKGILPICVTPIGPFLSRATVHSGLLIFRCIMSAVKTAICPKQANIPQGEKIIEMTIDGWQCI